MYGANPIFLINKESMWLPKLYIDSDGIRKYDMDNTKTAIDTP